MLVNIHARIALFRAYLAEFHSDADATVAFASRALALIGQDGRDVRLFTSIGSLVAGAMHQARLHRQLAAREQAAERFAEQGSERRRLAADIRDAIMQRLVSLTFHLDAACAAAAVVPARPG